MKKLLFAMIFMAATSLSFAQNDAYAEKLKTMFEVSGNSSSYKMAIEQMLGMFQQQAASIPAEDWAILEEKLRSTSLDDLVEMLVPVYQKQLTIEDLDGLIAFYNTPLGKKYAEKIPEITMETMTVSQQWGMKIGQEIQELIMEKGN
ncbi:MAG: hypothetical protein BM564_05090 [Bacteroidetes bacterium MedPE-SWsnd-G2]|nr:MAG: hypothetical protein BM564_05090 [Bacteroidetes bacterium MedPE-SWsnd-G2]